MNTHLEHQELDQRVQHQLPRSKSVEERLRLDQSEHEALIRKINSQIPDKEQGEEGTVI